MDRSASCFDLEAPRRRPNDMDAAQQEVLLGRTGLRRRRIGFRRQFLLFWRPSSGEQRSDSQQSRAGWKQEAGLVCAVRAVGEIGWKAAMTRGARATVAQLRRGATPW